MAQVFLSYSREDAARAQQIAEALGAEGVDVFWDNEIPPGSTWADYIEGKLTQCNALIVLWSEHSTKSQWVREEARMGRDKGVLIPVMIDTSTPPFGFGELQAANLSAWQGERDQPSWRRFADAVKNAANSAPRAAQNFAAAPPRDHAVTPPRAEHVALPPPKKGVPVWVWIVGAVIAVFVVLVFMGSGTREPPQQAADSQQQQVAPGQPQQQAPQVPPQSAQILTQQLQQAAQMAGQQGFQQVGQVFAGGLIQGQSWNVPAQLNAGIEYRVLGVCDQNCRDLDLSVYDASGATIAQDNATDDHPVIAVAPAANGAFTIQAQMFQCTGQPCYYALALYGRVRQ